MAGRCSARRSARGGEIVPASRTARARLGTALAALALAAALGAWPAIDVRPAAAYPAGAAASLALLLLAASLALGWPSGVAGSVGLLGAGYGAILALEDAPLDARAPVLAAGLLVVAELGFWSLELHAAVTPEPGTYLRRLALLCPSALGAMAAGGLLLLVVDVAGRGGLGLDLLGVAAAAAALGIVALLARRTAEPGSS